LHDPGGQDKKTSERIAIDPVCIYHQFPEWLRHCLLFFAMFGGASLVKTQNMCRNDCSVSSSRNQPSSDFGRILLDAVITKYKPKKISFPEVRQQGVRHSPSAKSGCGFNDAWFFVVVKTIKPFMGLIRPH
jgi:hypothetical protein